MAPGKHGAVLPMDEAPVTRTMALEPAREPSDIVGMIERLADRVGVDTLERIIAMRDREMARGAEAAFNAAFTAMQPEIPTIIERAHTDKTSYAPLEDIIEVIRPIYSAHGFSLGFQTEWPDPKTVKVIGILTHTDGHARRSEFISGADTSGSKNAIQALASAVSYGRRYVTKDLFCIVTRGEDDDAQGSEKHKGPAAPKGYDDWLADLSAAGDEGTAALERVWQSSNGHYKAHLTKHERATWEAVKTKAAKVVPS